MSGTSDRACLNFSSLLRSALFSKYSFVKKADNFSAKAVAIRELIEVPSCRATSRTLLCIEFGNRRLIGSAVCHWLSLRLTIEIC
jgi:hypothetical protein